MLPTGSRVERRFKIILLHQNGASESSIAHLVDCHVTTARRWAERMETNENLADLARSGRPPTFTQDVVLKTIAFHCQVSPLPGCSSWSLRWAEAHLKEHPEIIGCSVSRSSIQRFLKSHALHPHQRKYFLQITDPDFFPKMEHLVDLYLHPPEYLFNFDECTGIQAKEPLNPDLPAEPGKATYEEFEYVRHGTTDLMAFLRPKDGTIFARCTSDHNTQTLSMVFTEHVQSLPDDVRLDYIFDNLGAHSTEDFCLTVAGLSGVRYRPLKTAKERRTWLQSEGKRIVVHFTPFHGSWLNMIEIWFGILSGKCLKRASFQSVMHLQESIEHFVETWNSFFAHPFAWKYTGEGLHGKAMSRFSRLLLIESVQMTAKFLERQLLLMVNLLQNYSNSILPKERLQLKEVFAAKREYVDKIVDTDKRKRSKIKLAGAVEQLNDLLLSIGS